MLRPLNIFPLFPYTTLFRSEQLHAVTPDGGLTAIDYERNQSYEVQPDTALSLVADRKSTRLNSSHANISYAVFCMKKRTSVKTARLRRIGLPPNGHASTHS